MKEIYLFIGLLIILMHLAYITFLALKIKGIKESLAKERSRLRHQAIINDIMSMVAAELETGPVADIVLKGALQLVDAEMSALLIIEAGRVTGFYTSVAAKTEGCKNMATGIIKGVLEKGLPLRAADISKIEGFKGLPEGHPHIKNILIVPLLLRHEIVGELMLANRIGSDEFTQNNEDSLMALGIHAAIAIEKAYLYQKVVKLADTDGLTGLNNLRSFQQRLGMEFSRAERFNRELSLLMLDIDYFKKFNDTYGHPKGDEVLKTVAQIIISNIRSVDFSARYGGEEFVVILVESPLSGAIKAAERIRSSVEEHVFAVDGKRVSLTISIGAATFPNDADTATELLERADKALYYAKRTGRNKVSPFMEVLS